MKINFGSACGEVFRTEKKWMTILGIAVSMLIPIAGPMVGYGYLIRRFAREREGKSVEDFDFNLFGEYLKIGLWPILNSVILSVVMIPIVMLFILPVVIGAMLLEEHQAIGVSIMICGGVLYTASIILFTLVMQPVVLRSGLMMNFKAGFSLKFIISFVRKVGLSLFGYYLLLILISFPLSLLGYLAFIVGIFVVMAWVQVALMNLVFQHYDLFLARGGDVIEINPEVKKTTEFLHFQIN